MAEQKYPVMYRQLIKSFDNKEVADAEDYEYIYTELTDQRPACRPQILDQAVRMMLDMSLDDILQADVIVGEEDKGGFLAAMLSREAQVPFTVSTWYSDDIDEHVDIKFENGYKEGTLYLNGVEEGDKVFIVDDLISTGGTMKSLIEAIQQAGAEVVGAAVVFEKSNFGGVESVENEYDIEVDCGFDLVIEDGTSTVKEVYVD